MRVAQAVPGLTVIGALAYRGCTACVADSAVPPHVTPPTDVRAPPLVGVTSFELKPGATLTLLLSVSSRTTAACTCRRSGSTSPAASACASIQTLPGPELCAGKGC